MTPLTKARTIPRGRSGTRSGRRRSLASNSVCGFKPEWLMTFRALCAMPVGGNWNFLKLT